MTRRRANMLIVWERATAGILGGLRMRSIRDKIIGFALLATLIPSVTMGWLSYRNNRQVIEEKIANELTSLITQSSREIELTIEELRYEARVFSNSYEVLENLEVVARANIADEDRAAALDRARDYLRSVGEKFPDYEELLLMDVRGASLESDAAGPGTLGLPEDWPARVQADDTVIGEPVRDETSGAGVFVIVEPIRSSGGTLLGALGAKINIGKIREILVTHAADATHEIYVAVRSGRVPVSSADGPNEWDLAAATARRLFALKAGSLVYPDSRGVTVVGALREMPELGWGVGAHRDRATAYAPIIALRNDTLALTAAVSLIVGVAAYLLGLTIAPPLRRLAEGAAEVTRGNLDVSLPVYGHNEVSRLTDVFNGMVLRLRRFRDENARITEELRDRNVELHELSITDGLTGLYNRAYLPQILDKELARSRRHQHPFSILMADIDHFKRVNDTHGHQVGDEVLARVADVLKACVRASDYPARYGGEEFLILVTETASAGAGRLAEKVRTAIDQMEPIEGTGVSISVGVASYPEHAEEVDALIRSADEALYRAKREGRNRVVIAGTAAEVPDSAVC